MLSRLRLLGAFDDKALLERQEREATQVTHDIDIRQKKTTSRLSRYTAWYNFLVGGDFPGSHKGIYTFVLSIFLVILLALVVWAFFAIAMGIVATVAGPFGNYSRGLAIYESVSYKRYYIVQTLNKDNSWESYSPKLHPSEAMRVFLTLQQDQTRKFKMVESDNVPCWYVGESFMFRDGEERSPCFINYDKTLEAYAILNNKSTSKTDFVETINMPVTPTVTPTVTHKVYMDRIVVVDEDGLEALDLEGVIYE